jgi:hypothetical protein
VVLFILVALLVPRKWDEVTDLGVYFLSKRKWFYSFLLLGMMFDVADSAMKGGLAYIEANGALTWLQWIAMLPASIVGFHSTNMRLHATLAIVFFVWTAVIGFEVLPLLGL